MVSLCREKTEKAKAQLQWTLASIVSANQKGYCKYAKNKRTKKNIRVMIFVQNDHVTIRDEEKVEAFNAAFFFVSVFHSTGAP